MSSHCMDREATRPGGVGQIEGRDDLYLDVPSVLLTPPPKGGGVGQGAIEVGYNYSRDTHFVCLFKHLPCPTPIVGVQKRTLKCPSKPTY